MSKRRRVYMLVDKYLDDIQLHLRAGKTVEVAGWVADNWIAAGHAQEFKSRSERAEEAKRAERAKDGNLAIAASESNSEEGHGGDGYREQHKKRRGWQQQTARS